MVVYDCWVHILTWALEKVLHLCDLMVSPERAFQVALLLSPFYREGRGGGRLRSPFLLESTLAGFRNGGLAMRGRGKQQVFSLVQQS